MASTPRAALGARARGRARIVALTVDPDDELLAGVVEALDPDLLQLHGQESPERVADIGARFGRLDHEGDRRRSARGFRGRRGL